MIVDGYNVLGRRLKKGFKETVDLESARAWLLSKSGEYHSFTGSDVIIVYDAHQTTGHGSDEDTMGVRVLYTQPQETADERIERLVYDLRDRYRQLVVATSDAAEQQIAFGGGALRISADEWLRRLAATEKQIEQSVQGRNETVDLQRARVGDQIRQDVMKILEKWRRQ